MRFGSKAAKSKSEVEQPADRLSYLVEKLGIGGNHPMNITWGDLANILVFLLEAEAKRADEADRNATPDRHPADMS